MSIYLQMKLDTSMEFGRDAMVKGVLDRLRFKDLEITWMIWKPSRKEVQISI
jgi:hypothetical protein